MLNPSFSIKRMLSRDAHTAPTGRSTLSSVAGLPPAAATFRSSLPEKKPIQVPAGEKEGWYAPSVPASTTLVSSPTRRTTTRVERSWDAADASTPPSGYIARPHHDMPSDP